MGKVAWNVCARQDMRSEAFRTTSPNENWAESVIHEDAPREQQRKWAFICSLIDITSQIAQSDVLHFFRSHPIFSSSHLVSSKDVNMSDYWDLDFWLWKNTRDIKCEGWSLHGVAHKGTGCFKCPITCCDTTILPEYWNAVSVHLFNILGLLLVSLVSSLVTITHHIPKGYEYVLLLPYNQIHTNLINFDFCHDKSASQWQDSEGALTVSTCIHDASNILLGYM